MIEIPIATGFYQDASRPIASQECVNWIPTVPETNALSTVQLKRSPGIALFTTTGDGKTRGSHVMDSVPYFVVGSYLYRVNPDGTSTELGEIAGNDAVSMADNGDQLCIVVPSSVGYIYTASDESLVQITDSDYAALGPSKQVVYKDGYFVHLTDDKYFISNLNNGLVYDALDFGTAEVDPDNSVAMIVDRNVLYIGGSETLEPFQNVGGSDFPFRSIQGGVVPKGVKAPRSLIAFDNTFVFLGGSTNEQPAIWRFTGSGAVKISTGAIDKFISEQNDRELQDVYATTYSNQDGLFVNFHFSDATFSYDASASVKTGRQVWHERRSRNEAGVKTKWRVASIVNAYGKFIVGDALNGNIGHLTTDCYDEYGTLIDRDVASGNFHANGEPFIIRKIEITTQSGVGNTVDPQSQPLIGLQMSYDGGYTFGNRLTRSMGGRGQYVFRQVWWNLGRASRFAMFRLSISSETDAVIIKAEADIEVSNGTR